MGYERHHAIIVTSFKEEHIKRAFDAAKELRLDPTPFVKSWINEWYTFLIPPDGSKEFWAESEQGDLRRENFVQWLHQQSAEDLGYYRWAEVQYGDDDGDNRVLRSDAGVAPAPGGAEE